MHTAEQARELWCPMVRIARQENMSVQPLEDVIVGGCNTDALGRNRVPASCRCIASFCAMWRWGDGNTVVTDGAGNPKLMPHGYCGLAGRPEISAS